MTKKILKQFAIDGARIFPFSQQEGTIVDKVPPAFYHIGKTPFDQYFLEHKGDLLPVPEELYGTTQKRAQMVVDTYNRKDTSLGVALFGSKGAGKTLLSNVIANIALEQGLPVIDISGSFCLDSNYLDFINTIGDCVVIFDEFLKVLSHTAGTGEDAYSRRNAAEAAQDKMLTFFSGSNNAKRLTVLIDNESHLLSDYFKNRPSRLRYIFKYDSLEQPVIEALCQKAGLSEAQTEELVIYSANHKCTFDMINELIDEIVTINDSSVTLEEITRFFNTPSIFREQARRVRVQSFVDTRNEDYDPLNGSAKEPIILLNEIAGSYKDSVFVTFKRLTPWTDGKPAIKNQEEWQKYYESNSELLKEYNYDFDDFQEVDEDGYIECDVSMGSSSLRSMRNGVCTYSNGITTVEIVDDIEPPAKADFYSYY